MESFDRRLPVYILIDCSESMVGEAIEGANAGMRQLLLDLHSDPHALETVWISVITFAQTAEQVVPLTEMIGTKAPKLKIQPGTGLGAALRLLHECIAREVRTHSATQKGDWKPLVFLLSDGDPTDEWREAAKILRAPSKSGGKKLNLIAVGCGEDANPLVLNEIADTVLMMGDSEVDFRGLFQWISSSLSVSSQQIGKQEAVSLAKPPAELFHASSIPANAREELLRPRQPSQLFLSVRCSNYRTPYLVRYGWENEYGVYAARRVHVVDEDYFAGPKPGEDAQMGVSSEKLFGVLPCPHCGNRAAGACPTCGQVFCAPEDDSNVQCPGCLRVLSGGGPSEFSISGRVG